MPAERSGRAGRGRVVRVDLLLLPEVMTSSLLGPVDVLAAAGMASEREWLVNLALGVLIVGFGLRFVGRTRESEPEDEGDT